MGSDNGIIYAPGTGPDEKKNGSGTSLRNLCHRMAPCFKRKTQLTALSGKKSNDPPPYSAYPSGGYGGYGGYNYGGGYGSGNAFSHMIPPPLLATAEMAASTSTGGL